MNHFDVFRPCLRRLGLVLWAVCGSLFVVNAYEVAPEWWGVRSVLYDCESPNDYAALNQGQLKHLAYMAWLEMGTLDGGAGFEPSFTNAANDYAAVTIGQLKETAKPFYDRLELSDRYPWPASSNDFAIANIGQAKFLFSFDPRCAGDIDQDGMPDRWEIANGLNPYVSSDAALDSDGDGLINLDEYLIGSDPNAADGAVPAATPASSPVVGPGVAGLLILNPPAAVR